MVFCLRGQLFNSGIMHKFTIKLLNNEDEPFGTKTELLNFKITLPLTMAIIPSLAIRHGWFKVIIK